MKLFEPHQDSITYGMTRAADGSFNDETQDFEGNLEWLMKACDFSRPVFAKQIHSDIILNVEKAPEERPEADAFITATRGLPLMIKVADCQGVLIYDPIHQVIAAVHSGWRGSSQNIIGKTITKMKKDYGCHPKDLLVEVSPSLGPCCMEFSDPKTELPKFCQKYVEENRVDFWTMTMDQCQEAGILEQNVEIRRTCTRCNPAYFSHRRGDTGRIAVFIALK